MKILVLIVTTYLLGSVPAGSWVGGFFYHVNLREHGSGNIGITNTFRVSGPKAGTVTFTTDMLKGTVATLLPYIPGVTAVSPILIGLFAIIGHTFPAFAKLKGGKAVATSADVLLGFAPMFLLYLSIIFVGTLYLFSMISLSNVVAAAVTVVSVLIFPAFSFLLPHYDLLFTLIIVLIASIIIIRHKDNITRIQKYKENLVPWGLSLSKQKVD